MGCQNNATLCVILNTLRYLQAGRAKPGHNVPVDCMTDTERSNQIAKFLRQCWF